MGKRKRYQADHRADMRGGRLLGVPYAVLNSEAYRQLSTMERAVLIEIILRFNGYNNGAISISYKELAHRLNRKNEAPFGPAVAKLISHGLIDIGMDACWKERMAREYRLTFVSTTDRAGRQVAATNEYLHWAPEENSGATKAVAGTPESATPPIASGAKTATGVVVPLTQNRGFSRSRLLRGR
jgi:hypothetical protein